MKSSNYIILFLSLVFGFSITSCKDEKPVMAYDTLFSLLPAEDTGIDFNNKITEDKEKNILLYANFYGGAGVGVGDFNNDGLQDVFFAGNMVPDKLYLNQGDFKFDDVTKTSGITNDGGWSTGVTVADINNDGHLDIYVSRELYDNKPDLRTNLLYINNGDATFTEQAAKYGINNNQRTRHATFLDYDNDGLLDLFLLTQPPNPGNFSEYKGTNLIRPEYTIRLYQNKKDHFIDVTQQSGLLRTGFPNGVSASDFNNDGWTDIYVANDFYAPDYLFINQGNGTFVNTINASLNHMSYYSMGVDVADINNDLLLDVFVLDMVAEDNFRLKSNMSGMDVQGFWDVVDNGGHYQYMFNTLQLNNGNTTFSDVAQLTGMSATDWSWANLIADFDNDGHKDAYITNGLLRDIRNTDADKKVGDFVLKTANKWIKENPNGGDISIWDILDLEKTLDILPSVPLKNYAYKNNGNLNFEKISEEWGIDQESFSNGAAYADFDNDGDLDIVVNNINASAFIYRNNTINNYLTLKVKSQTNQPIFGTRVIINENDKDKQQIIEFSNVRGIYSTSQQIAHFGLGDSENVANIRIIWPDKKETLLSNIKSNQNLEVFLENAKVPETKSKKTDQQLFSSVKDGVPFKHKHTENDFDDYEKQILLPHKMSQFGPALAVSDVNGDGMDDVFVGGATGFQAKLYIQKENGSFENTNDTLFKSDTTYEDVDALFFDIDSDGDDDLYVVSGGNAFSKGNKNYKDRLYINNGSGIFSKSSLSISNFSGSIVIPNDFDKDGDLDLFVGGRHLPHNYPEATPSKLLENKNGKLIDVTSEKAEILNNIGMVTDAIWADYDKDNDADLILVGEWMPITILNNENGTFTPRKYKDLENTKGWWFSIEQGDFDKDGDIDFIAGNLGLNYKYKTSKDEPFDIYYKDFDENGKSDIVLGYYNFGKHYPLRGFSCSSNQVPNLKKTIKEYDVFASLELTDIYGEKNMSDALHLTTDTFASLYIENLGDGTFKLSELPIEAQFSNINDMLVHDYNEDGNLDVLLAGNLFVSEIETTRNDGGVGLLLEGDGSGNFEAIRNTESGFFANKDVKKIKMIQHKIINKNMIIVANNNDKIDLFYLNKPN